MACFIHKITKAVQLSVPASRQLPDLWVNIGSPDNLPLHIPKRYWRVNAEEGRVDWTEDPAEMAEEDAEHLLTLKARKIQEVESWFLEDLEDLYPSHRQKYITDEVKEAREDGLLNRVAYLRQYRPWYKAGLATLKSRIDLINAATSIQQLNDVSPDDDPFAEWRESDPKIEVFIAEAIED